MKRITFALLFLSSLLAYATDKESTGFITAHDGVRLSYRKLGDGPQAAIVPGGFLFDGAFDRFATPGRTVIFYDMRNRGRSDAVKDLTQVTIQNDVRDLEAVRAHFGVKKASLIGYSYLGFLVVLYAMDHPEHVERIIQLGAVPRQWDTEYPPGLRNNDRAQIVDKEAWSALQELEKQGYKESHPREFCEQQWKVFRRFLVGKAENAVKLPGWCDLPNEWPVNFEKHLEAHFVGSVQKLKVPKEGVAKVTVPVLTLHGTLDRNAAYGAGREWALTLPNARLVTVKGAAHQSWVDEPELVLGSIETFLRGDWPKEAQTIISLEDSAQATEQSQECRPMVSESTQRESVIAQIKASTREFVEGFNSGDVDRLMRFYADRYVDVNMRQPVQTRAERQEYFRKLLARRDTTVEVIPSEIMVQGEYAFVRGTILLTRRPANGAPSQFSELRYMEVARRFPDGWKAIWGIDAELYPDAKE